MPSPRSACRSSAPSRAIPPCRCRSVISASSRPPSIPPWRTIWADSPIWPRQHLDLDAILAAARPLRAAASPASGGIPPPGQRIALARDAAFSFVYPHLLAGWSAAGAEILPFSPLADEAPPPDADAVWLPGGYPELHAARLAGAARFRDGLRRFAETRPVHGECGGYMVLGAALTDADGRTHAMTGLLSHSHQLCRAEAASRVSARRSDRR